MRRAAKIDANHEQVVSALRAAGARVLSLAAIGGGVPDLLVGHGCRFYALEVKDGSLPPSKRRLTADQEEWHREWADYPVCIVHSPEEALRFIGVIK